MLNIKEAERCINCKIPKCVEGCPINNRIPEFISKIKENNYEEAYRIIRSISPLGAICGRVCPHENQCQGNCVRGINAEPIPIGKLESFICDWARENDIKLNYDIKNNNIKVAIIGGGPAGIACAVDLRRLGYDITIFEKENYLGGILMYGIPEYRLSKKLVKDVIDDLLELGMHVKLNTILTAETPKDECSIDEVKESLYTKHINRTNKQCVTISSLFEEGYKAIFLGIGSEISNILSIDGKNANGVIGANEFLKNKRECKGKKVIVIGGGNVAMDAARVAKKEGGDVTIVYRRRKEDMPANKDEIEAAEKEGIKFIFKTNIIKINSKEMNINKNSNLFQDNINYGKNVVENNYFVSNVECDTGEIIETDYVVMAIGSTPNVNYLEKDIKLTEQGLIEINDNYETSIKNVYAGGDLVQKKATVCMAIKNGKEAAIQINNSLKKGIQL